MIGLAVELYAAYPAKHGVALHLAEILAESGADGGAIEWTADEPTEFTWWFPALRLGKRPTVRYLGGSDPAGRTWMVGVSDPRRTPTPASLSLGWRHLAKIFPRPDGSAEEVDHSLIAHLLATLRAISEYGWHLRDDFADTVGWLVEVDPHHDRHAAADAVRRLGTAIRSGVLEEMVQATSELAARLEELGDHNSATELYALAYDAAIPLVDAGLSIELARYAGRAARRAGSYPEAIRWYEQAARLARYVDDIVALALAHSGMTWAHMDRGATPRARQTASEAMRLAGASGDRWAQGEAFLVAGYVARLSGKTEEAMRLYWCSAKAYEDPGWRARALMALGTALVDTGNLDAAERSYSIAFRSLSGSTQVLCLDALAWIHALRGHAAAYDRAWRRVESRLSEADPRDLAQVKLYRAHSLALLRRSEEATQAKREAVEYARAHGFLQFSERAHLEVTPPPDPALRDEHTSEIEEWLVTTEAAEA